MVGHQGHHTHISLLSPGSVCPSTKYLKNQNGWFAKILCKYGLELTSRSQPMHMYIYYMYVNYIKYKYMYFKDQ